MMKKLLWSVLGLLLLTIVGALGLLWYAVGTQAGLLQLLTQGQKYAPGELSWAQAKGRLLGPLDLQALHYRQADGLQLEVREASLRWQPRQLFSRRLRIDRLHISDLDIHLPPPSHSPAPAQAKAPLNLPDLKLPLALDLHDIDLNNIRIFPYGAEAPIEVEAVKLVAAGAGEQVQLIEFRLQSPMAQASFKGQLQPTGDYPLELHTQWRYTHPTWGQFQGSGGASGALKKTLHLDQHIAGPVQLNLSAKLEQLLDTPQWEAQLSAESADLGLFAPQLKAAPVQLSLHSQGSPQAFSATGTMDTQLPQTGPLALTLNLRGNTQFLQFNELRIAQLEGPANITFAGEADIQKQQVDLQGQWEALAWPLNAAPEFSAPSGTVQVKGGPQAFTAQLQSQVNGQSLRPLTLAANLSGSRDLIELQRLDFVSADQVLQLQAQGRFDIPQQRFETSGDWQSLAWPMQGEAQLESPNGRFNASGRLDHYRLGLVCDLSGQEIPASHWQFSGEGTAEALSSFQLLGKLLDGELKATGQAGWQPAPHWQVALTGAGLNPGRQWPEFPGKIALDLQSAGQLTPDGPDLSVILANLQGQLRDQPLNGRGQVKLQGQTLEIDALELSSGSANLRVNGSLADRWDLRWRLDAERLADLLPEFKGAIQSNGQLTGLRNQPRARLKLKTADLNLGTAQIKQLTGSADVDVSGKRRSQLDVSGEDLHLGGQQWQRLALRGDGLPDRHQFQVTLSGKLAQLALGLDGGLQGALWQGRLTQLAASQTGFGDWALQTPASLTLGNDRARLQALCLDSAPARLCVDGQWQKTQGGQVDLELAGLKPARFKAYLPPGLRIDTTLSGKARAHLDRAGLADASADLRLQAGRIFFDAGVEPLDVQTGESRIEAQLKAEGQAGVRLDLDLGRIGTLKAATNLTGLRPDAGLQGQVRMNVQDLTLISAFAPQLQEISGTLEADLGLDGTLAQPAITGALQLKDFGGSVPQVAMRIEDTQLTARSSGQGPLQISGRSRSGSGTLNLAGTLAPATRALQLNLKGERYQVANSETLRAEISPDLRIGMDSQGMAVQGEVVIPSAYINANAAGGEAVVSASPDVTIIEADGQPAPEKQVNNLNLNVRVVLGDDIKVEAGDFSGALKGSLVVEQKPELAPRGTGTIEVVNGDYVVYGQQLKIQRGRILFGGGPIDNPRLDLDVARRVEAYDVTAGARIRGTAQAPLLQLYSEPAMPDASILSYMLLGQPPGTKGGSYTLGKYLTPDLYVSYGIGLLNAINTFNMRYRLTDRLALQAASGLASSADLIYTIER